RARRRWRRSPGTAGTSAPRRDTPDRTGATAGRGNQGPSRRRVGRAPAPARARTARAGETLGSGRLQLEDGPAMVEDVEFPVRALGEGHHVAAVDAEVEVPHHLAVADLQRPDLALAVVAE